MQATVKWQSKVRFQAESGTGHNIIIDGPESKGGENAGPRPMEMLLMGIGGCSSYDVINILKKTRQDVTDCQVLVTAERADAVPAVFTRIHLSFTVLGNNLKASQVEKAVSLSAEKYCSASIMFQNAGVEVTHDFTISTQA